MTLICLSSSAALKIELKTFSASADLKRPLIKWFNTWSPLLILIVPPVPVDMTLSISLLANNPSKLRTVLALTTLSKLFKILINLGGILASSIILLTKRFKSDSVNLIIFFTIVFINKYLLIRKKKSIFE